MGKNKYSHADLIQYNRLFIEYLRQQIQELTGDSSGSDWSSLGFEFGVDTWDSTPFITSEFDPEDQPAAVVQEDTSSELDADPEDDETSLRDFQRQQLRKLYADDDDEIDELPDLSTSQVSNDDDDDGFEIVELPESSDDAIEEVPFDEQVEDDADIDYTDEFTGELEEAVEAEDDDTAWAEDFTLSADDDEGNAREEIEFDGLDDDFSDDLGEFDVEESFEPLDELDDSADAEIVIADDGEIDQDDESFAVKTEFTEDDQEFNLEELIVDEEENEFEAEIEDEDDSSEVQVVEETALEVDFDEEDDEDVEKLPVEPFFEDDLDELNDVSGSSEGNLEDFDFEDEEDDPPVTVDDEADVVGFIEEDIDFDDLVESGEENSTDSGDDDEFLDLDGLDDDLFA